MPSDCEICQDPRAFDTMQKVYKGVLTYAQAAEHLGKPLPTVWKCFKEHWEAGSDSEGKVQIKVKEAKDAEGFVSILRASMDRLIKTLEELMLSGRTDPGSVKAIVAMHGEVRATMRSILEFEGQLKTGLSVQINVLNLQLTKLTSWCLQNLSEEDQMKLATALPSIMQDTTLLPQQAQLPKKVVS